MNRQCALEDISDGRLYTENDMVKVDTGGCKGCTIICCQGMDKTIILDPYDVHRLCLNLHSSFEQLLNGKIEINIVDGLMLPNIKMVQDTNACSFLSADNRCAIHQARPSVCRLFPLGRFWEDEEHFKYIVQKGQCHKSNLTKIKVKKWIEADNSDNYKNFLIDWHKYVRKMQKKIADIVSQPNFDSVAVKECCKSTLQNFYMICYDSDEKFYQEFQKKIKEFYEN